MLFQKIQRCSKEKVWGKHPMGKSYVTTIRHFFALKSLFTCFLCAQIDLLLPLVLMSPCSHGLTTYKELCSLASDLNQPDLVYKFMNLANHHAMWNSRKVSCIVLFPHPPHVPLFLPTRGYLALLPST